MHVDGYFFDPENNAALKSCDFNKLRKEKKTKDDWLGISSKCIIPSGRTPWPWNFLNQEHWILFATKSSSFTDPWTEKFVTHLPWTMFSVHRSSFGDPWTKKFISHLPWTVFIVHCSSFGDPWTKKFMPHLPWTVFIVHGSSFTDPWTSTVRCQEPVRCHY